LQSRQVAEHPKAQSAATPKRNAYLERAESVGQTRGEKGGGIKPYPRPIFCSNRGGVSNPTPLLSSSGASRGASGARLGRDWAPRAPGVGARVVICRGPRALNNQTNQNSKNTRPKCPARRGGGLSSKPHPIFRRGGAGYLLTPPLHKPPQMIRGG
jgi:hypothetical protein